MSTLTAILTPSVVGAVKSADPSTVTIALFPDPLIFTEIPFVISAKAPFITKSVSFDITVLTVIVAGKSSAVVMSTGVCEQSESFSPFPLLAAGSIVHKISSPSRTREESVPLIAANNVFAEENVDETNFKISTAVFVHVAPFSNVSDLNVNLLVVKASVLLFGLVYVTVSATFDKVKPLCSLASPIVTDADPEPVVPKYMSSTTFKNFSGVRAIDVAESVYNLVGLVIK